MSALRSAFMAGTSAIGRAIGRPPVAAPVVAYVVAIVAGDLVGIYRSSNLARDIASIQREVPASKIGYILAVAVDPKMISRLAEGNLSEWAVGGGWFRTTLEEAEAAIDAAAKAYTGISPFHSTTDAVIATSRRRR
ncbi:hypothetical protein ACQZ4Y_20115 [Rhizobium sp. L80/93]|uniref:hypothetical protein n=1 Tax=unclassified Rhizobium TaxID=2613769 RepID=UPI001ADB7BCF|nr:MULTISPECIES: hypothetical protein [unclassified Rhizobium]MBO9136907.1 hypothetical protein [Rhizobium sp. B209b/85]MBO9186802.1 hypothetical protein [Rhizobium sp. E27B/91]QXZ99093.1 hypothetical protein J5289_21650 [Rhizobium sp. B230/85]